MLRTTDRVLQLGILAFHFLFFSVAFAGIDPVNKNEDGNALRGFDAVAFFTNGKPVRGDETFSVEWNGATWLFASAANKKLFEKNPGLYAPQYGGYCAYAVGNNYTADGDPYAWSIVNGKLYLNYNKQVRAIWKIDHEELIRKGDENWPKLLQK